jgi:hypothetical protein
MSPTFKNMNLLQAWPCEFVYSMDGKANSRVAFGGAIKIPCRRVNPGMLGQLMVPTMRQRGCPYQKRNIVSLKLLAQIYLAFHI